jgi:hypothetical protein
MPKKDDKLLEQKKRLKEDLKEFSHDCEEILHHHELINDTNFLDRFSEDIQDLESDTLEFSNDPSAQMIHYYLSTPMGAPFISRKTMLEAAASYQNQEPLKSDLYELVDGMIHFGDQEKNPLLLLFKSIEEYLEKEELKN